MWYVGSLKTNGDARDVQGYTIGNDKYAFLADGSKGLSIIKITNPESPVLTSGFDTEGFASDVFVDSVNSGIYAFVSDNTKGLYIINATNPASPSLCTLLTFAQGVNSSKQKNGYLYAATVQGQVKIFNISALPDSVYETGTYNPKGPAEKLEISENILYMVERIAGIETADITNPSVPSFMSTFRPPGSCYDLRISGHLAYIADGIPGICTANFGNPYQPYFVKETKIGTDIRGIDYSPNFLFTAELDDGVSVYNLFTVTEPDLFGYLENIGICYAIQHFRGKVLVANGGNGLLILRF